MNMLILAAIAAGQLISSEPVRAEKTFLASFDGSRQKYVELVPGTFRPEAGALVALHGHGSDRHQFVDDTRGECAAAREAALLRGLLYVSPDYRAKTSWMGPAAESDMLDLLETLRRERGIAKFYFCGGSMGGTSALTFAVRHPDLVAGVEILRGAEWRPAGDAAAWAGDGLAVRTEGTPLYRSLVLRLVREGIVE